MFVECDLESGLRLRGYVDRLDEAPDGALRVVDYKTGRAPREGFEAKAMFQMRFYALVLWRLRGQVPGCCSCSTSAAARCCATSPTRPTCGPPSARSSRSGPRSSAPPSNGDWRPSPSRLCDWCDHQALCPAFGGTPPELPVLPVPVVPQASAADERPSPHTPADEV